MNNGKYIFSQMVDIIEHKLKLNRNIYEVIRILGSSLLARDDIKDLFMQAISVR